MRTSSAIHTPRGSRARHSFAFAAGLDWLRRNSPEHKILAQTLLDAWGPVLRQISDSHLLTFCDVGTGFGDLAGHALSGLEAQRPALSISAELVDRDPRLAAYAAGTLSGRPRLRVSGHSAELPYRKPEAFHFVLAAHVLYYVADRRSAIDGLAEMAACPGAVSVVLRHETCASFVLRSVMRAEAAESQGGGTAERITSGVVSRRLQAAGLEVREQTVEFVVKLPRSEVDYVALRAGRRSTDATEFLRLLGHIAPDGSTPDSMVGAFLSALSAYDDGDQLVIPMRDSLVTGYRT